MQKKDDNRLYNYDYEPKEEEKLKAKRKKADTKSASKNKKQDKNKLDNKNVQAPQRKKYDDEIIIGVTRYPDKKNTENKTRKKNEKRKNNKIGIKQSNVNINNKKTVYKTYNVKQFKKFEKKLLPENIDYSEDQGTL